MVSPLNYIPNPRSCEYYQFFTGESSYQVYQKASNWKSGLWEGGKTLSWNCLVGVSQFILNRFIDLGKLACWTTQSLPICLTFKNSVNELEKTLKKTNDMFKDLKENTNYLEENINYLEKNINDLKDTITNLKSENNSLSSKIKDTETNENKEKPTANPNIPNTANPNIPNTANPDIPNTDYLFPHRIFNGNNSNGLPITNDDPPINEIENWPWPKS